MGDKAPRAVVARAIANGLLLQSMTMHVILSSEVMVGLMVRVMVGVRNVGRDRTSVNGSSTPTELLMGEVLTTCLEIRTIGSCSALQRNEARGSA